MVAHRHGNLICFTQSGAHPRHASEDCVSRGGVSWRVQARLSAPWRLAMLLGVGRWQLRNSLMWMMMTSSSTLVASSSSLAPSASRLAAERGAKTNPLEPHGRRYLIRASRPTRVATASLLDGEERRASSSKASSSSSESDANDLSRRFAETARSTGAFQPGDLVLACVSGGADSVALLHLLVQLRDAWNLDVRAVHFNHEVRGDESADDAVFVKALCARLNVELHVCVPEKPFAPSNFQANARQWRRDTAVKLLESLKANVVLQGHHADDQTETTLLKLLRGCHISRIAGMRPREGVFGRPLLSFLKRELVAFLESRAEKWREDPSNASPKYLRNRVREELIPLLRELVDEGGVASRVEALTEQSANLRELLDEVPSAYLAHGDGPVTSPSPFDRSYLVRGEIDLDVWSTLPTLAREDQLRAYVSDCAGVEMEYHVLRKMCTQLFARVNADVSITDMPEWEWRIRGDWVLRSVGTRAWAAKNPRLDLRANKGKQASDASDGDGDAKAQAIRNEVFIDAGRGVSITHPPGWLVRACWENSRSTDGSMEGVRLANLPDVCTLQLRFRQPGDAFRPGHSRRVKLKDWMRGNDMPLHSRDRTPLVCLGDDVLAVYPHLSADASPCEDGSAKDVRNGARLNIIVDCISVDDSQAANELE